MKLEIKSFLFSISALFIFLWSTFPGKGGLEGHQREKINWNEKIDNWGFLTTYIYDNFPNILGNWHYSLVFFQLVLLWIGIYFLIDLSNIKEKLSKLYFVILTLISSVFVSQLWRDATLLAFLVFGLGLYQKARNFKLKTKIPIYTISFLSLFLSVMLKPLYGIVIGVIFLWLILQNHNKNRSLIIFGLIYVVFLSFTPYFADKYLSSNNKMIKVYPEQQPIIFDLASNYCWGTSPKIAEDAKKILRLVLKNDFPPESICAALKPNRWDNLHSDVNQWEFSAPITRIIGAENINLRNQLVQGWMSMIMQSPFDWVQVRFMYLGWTLITSNSFIPQSRDKYNNFYGKDINFILWNLFYIPVTVFDKMRFLSLGFSLFFFLFILIRVRGFPKSEKRSRLSYNISSAILCLILTTAITMVGFVASNGRYVLPYIIVTHFLILKEYISIRNYK